MPPYQGPNTQHPSMDRLLDVTNATMSTSSLTASLQRVWFDLLDGLWSDLIGGFPGTTPPTQAWPTEMSAKGWNGLQGRGVPVRYVELIQKYSPGYIILSYVIAVVGSLCTLELLLRR